MKMYWSMLLFLGLVWACDKDLDSNGITPAPHRFLALGDSYTIGQGVSASERWPVQLFDSLNSEAEVLDSLRIIAQTGWRTDDLLSAIQEEEPLEAELVSLLIGVNDQFQGVDTLQFQANFDLLLQKAFDIAGGTDRVFVVSIPDYGVTPFGAGSAATIAEELDAYNAFIRFRCETERVPFIDVTSISRELADQEGALANDDLHPSGSQYRAWMEAIYPIAESMIIR